MPRFICPGYNAEVNESSKICPKCGFRLGEIQLEKEQQSPSHSWVITLLIVIGLFILFFK
jgi:C4-type Zn-finger protein